MRTVLSNYLFMAFSNFAALGLNFVFSYFMVQKLSPDAYGLQSALLSFAAIVTGISFLGLLEVGTRELARRPDEEHAALYGNLIALHLTLSTIICLFSAGFVLLTRSFTGNSFIIFLLAMFTLVFSFAPTVPTEALLTARGKIKTVALLQGSYTLATTVVGSVILYLQSGSNSGQFADRLWGIASITTTLLGDSTLGKLWVLYIVLSLISILSIVLYLYIARKTLGCGFQLRLNKAESILLLRHGFPGGVATTLFAFTMRFGTYYVFIYVGNKETAYLGVSNLVLQAVTSVVWVPFAVNILPIMTRVHMASEAQLKWIGSRSLTILIAITVPIAIGTSLMSADILSFLSKTQIVAAPTLQIFVWVLPVSVIAAFAYRWLLIVSKQHVYLVATVIGAVVNALVCVVLVPTSAALGAAWAAVISLIVVDLICLWNLRGWIRGELKVLDAVRILGSILSLIAVIHVATGWTPIARIATGALVYVIILAASGIISVDEIKLLRSLLTQHNVLADLPAVTTKT